MKTQPMATMWPLFTIAFFFVLVLGCKKDLSLPTEMATPTDWKVSQEQFDKAKASLSGEASARFFDFDYATQNNPNVVAAAAGRDENEDALRALCVELIEQNQQYNFASDLISRVGFPMWSRSMFYTNSAQNDAPIVVLPFAHLNDDSTRAFVLATPIDNYWYIRLATRIQLDSLLTNAPNSDNLRFNIAMLGIFDNQVFDNPTMRYVDFIFGPGVTIPAGDRCFSVSAIMVLCPEQMVFTGEAPSGDRSCPSVTYIDDCFPWYPGMEPGMGGGDDNSWFNGGSITTGDGEGGYGFGGGSGIYSSFADLNGGASPQFVFQLQAYLGSLEPDGGNQQWENLTPSEMALFEQINILNGLGLFALGQLEAGFNNPDLTVALIAYLQAHPGDPTAQEVASLLLNAVGFEVLSESQAITLLELQEILNLTAEQVVWLATNSQVIAQMDQCMTNYANDPLLIQGLQTHIDLLMTDDGYFEGNANASFPNIGTEDWVSTLEEQGGYPLGSFFELKQAERVFCELHPLAALEIKENRTIAVEKQAAFWGWGGVNVTWLGKGDAFLHTYFQAINTQKIGATLTQQFADAHETEHPQILHLETYMDLFNNGVGISIGVEQPSLDIHAMADYVNQAVLQGLCKYLDPVDHVASPPYDFENPANCPNCLNGIW